MDIVADQVDLMCPCCGTTVMAAMADTEHECGRCGQKWQMVVDIGRIMQFSAL